jgi:GT2 family glycosyltransferase
MIKNPAFSQFFHPEIKKEPTIVTELLQKQQSNMSANQQTDIGKKMEIKKGFTSIIIPVYLNSYPVFHYTGHCIGSIREHTDRAKTPYEIIFVQNGSREIGGVVEEFDKIYCEKFISNKENLGYAKAVNQGIRIAEGEYIAIINNDTMVFDHWLEDMQEALNNGLDLVMAQPMYGMPFARAVEANRFREDALGKSIPECFDTFRDFSCVLTKQETFDKVGLFNEEFFAYGEDLDLIRRIEKSGGKVASTKRTRIFHVIGGTSNSMPEIPEIMNKNKEILQRIWGK